LYATLTSSDQLESGRRDARRVLPCFSAKRQKWKIVQGTKGRIWTLKEDEGKRSCADKRLWDGGALSTIPTSMTLKAELDPARHVEQIRVLRVPDDVASPEWVAPPAARTLNGCLCIA
jgi:hypothetical protein